MLENHGRMNFAISSKLLNRHKRSMLRKRGIEFIDTVAKVAKYYEVDVVFISVSDLNDAMEVVALTDIYPDKAAPRCECALAGPAEIPFFAGNPGKITIQHDLEDKNEAADPSHDEAIAFYAGLLQHFSKIAGGIDIVFHVDESLFSCEPRASTKNCIHIFIDTGPGGELHELRRASIFGLAINPREKETPCAAPTPGRGTVINDDRAPVAQICGSSFYFLAPLLSCYTKETSATMSVIFQLLLSRCWDAYRGKRKQKVSPASQKQFVSTACDWLDEIPKNTEREIQNGNTKLACLMRDITSLQNKIFLLTKMLDAARSRPSLKNEKSRFKQDWKRIKSEPDVACLAIVDDGLQVYTKPIVIEWNRVSYFMGAYIIRINARGIVSVWTERGTHPQQVPHPHIAKDTGPCFGNATEAILKSAAEYRFGDAISYILRWLKFGYTSASARSKIEEWPTTDQISCGCSCENNSAREVV